MLHHNDSHKRELRTLLDTVNWQEIRDLLAMLQESSITELTLEVKDFRLTVRKGTTLVFTEEKPSPPSLNQPEVEKAEKNGDESAPTPTSTPKRKGINWVEVASPMVGTFYSAPAPGEADFVRLGDRVQKGQALCIVEAMKHMNEIEAETPGRIVEILVTNSQLVEFGQVLFRIDPEG
jgi:acetyl-CoA carboxylase biotin carboxyl carrier protein